MYEPLVINISIKKKHHRKGNTRHTQTCSIIMNCKLMDRNSFTIASTNYNKHSMENGTNKNL